MIKLIIQILSFILLLVPLIENIILEFLETLFYIGLIFSINIDILALNIISKISEKISFIAKGRTQK